MKIIDSAILKTAAIRMAAILNVTTEEIEINCLEGLLSKILKLFTTFKCAVLLDSFQFKS